MNERLPRVTSGQTEKALEKSGFFLSRQSGSHKIYKNESGARVTIPHHAGKIIHPKILKTS
ncbi:MAG: type II toxin-antitoxin system HicA family toxin [Nitrospinae bacterium]|nr:type II toxin-antitoxin system HicA family toxin [Nitrospinota bacterium]